MLQKLIMSQRINLMKTQVRLCGMRTHFGRIQNIDPDNRYEDEFLDPTEITTRMNWILHQFKLWDDLKTIDWKADFDKIGLDSLDSTAVLTSMEHEFHVVFEDKVFENFNNLSQVRNWILNDHMAF